MKPAKVRDLTQSVQDDAERAGGKRYAVWWQRQCDVDENHEAMLHCANIPARLLAERLRDAVSNSGPVIVYRVEEQ